MTRRLMALLLVGGCAPTLNQRGDLVHELNEPPPDCEQVGPFEGTAYCGEPRGGIATVAYFERCREEATAVLRNRAGDGGANVVVKTGESSEGRNRTVRATGYKCRQFADPTDVLIRPEEITVTYDPGAVAGCRKTLSRYGPEIKIRRKLREKEPRRDGIAAVVRELQSKALRNGGNTLLVQTAEPTLGKGLTYTCRRRADSPPKPIARPASSTDARPAPVRILVLDLVSVGAPPESLISMTTDELLTGFASLDNVETLGRADINAMAAAEKMKDLLACNSDTACMVEIGGALGVDLIAHGQLGQVGAGYRVSLALLDVGRQAVASRVSTLASDDRQVLEVAVPELVSNVVAALNRPR